MTATTEHDNLAAALAAFQAEVPSVPKSKTAKVKGKSKSGADFEYSYSYADLADVSAAALPLLAKHGLAFSALPRSTDSGYELAGMLIHVSGEEKEGALPLSGQTPQEIGSSLTYMRRYLLGCLTGIVTDDDDDGAAASQSRSRTAPRAQRVAAVPAPEPLDAGSVDEVLAAIGNAQVSTEALRSKLVTLGAANVPNGAVTRGAIQSLTPQQAIDTVVWLDSLPRREAVSA